MAIDGRTASVTDCGECAVVINRASQCAMLAGYFGSQSMPESEREWCMALAINCDDVPAIDFRGPDCSMAVNCWPSRLSFDASSMASIGQRCVALLRPNYEVL